MIALKEAEELWGALQTPMDTDHPMAKDLLGNPAARRSISSVDRRMLTSPSMASIAGTEFEANGKGRLVPTQQPRLGRILGGIGTMGGVFDFLSTIKLALDPDAANAHLCATGFSWYCNTESPMA